MVHTLSDEMIATAGAFCVYYQPGRTAGRNHDSGPWNGSARTKPEERPARSECYSVPSPRLPQRRSSPQGQK